MYLRRIELRDFKAYQHAVFDFPRPTSEKNVILIGGLNGYGKTTLFEALVLGLEHTLQTWRHAAAELRETQRQIETVESRGPEGRRKEERFKEIRVRINNLQRRRGELDNLIKSRETELKKKQKKYARLSETLAGSQPVWRPSARSTSPCSPAAPSPRTNRVATAPGRGSCSSPPPACGRCARIRPMGSNSGTRPSPATRGSRPCGGCGDDEETAGGPVPRRA